MHLDLISGETHHARVQWDQDGEGPSVRETEAVSKRAEAVERNEKHHRGSLMDSEQKQKSCVKRVTIKAMSSRRRRLVCDTCSQ